MGTIRRQAVSDLQNIEQESKTLARIIEKEMDDELAPLQMTDYLARAKWIRQRLDHLDEQLKRLKDII